jgi:hypothetical protein
VQQIYLWFWHVANSNSTINWTCIAGHAASNPIDCFFIVDFHGYPGTGYSPKESSNPRETLEDLGGVGKKLVLKKERPGSRNFHAQITPGL